MKKYRYIGIRSTGHSIRGTIAGIDKQSVKQVVALLEVKESFTLRKIIPEQIFTYKAQKNSEPPIKGEQRAFEKSDVEIALRKMDYRILSIHRKINFFNLRPPARDIVVFIRICADMLREKLPYDEILQLLSTDTTNKALKQTLREIGKDLKDGNDGKEVFGKHERTFGRFPAYMLGVASTSGNMEDIYPSTARFMERNEDFKKNLRQALVMPFVVLFFLALAIIFYVAYIFPKTAELFLRYDIELPPMTAAVLDMSAFAQDNYMLFVAGALVNFGTAVMIFRSKKGRKFIDAASIKLPYIGSLLHKTSIEIFSRVFHSLYSESGNNIHVIRIAAEACRNSFMESRIKTIAIPMLIKEGKGLVESLEKTGVFTRSALSRLRSGSEAGALKSATLQLANYYEKETSYKLKSCIDMINITISIIIVLVVIGLTILSSESAVLSPKMPGLSY